MLRDHNLDWGQIQGDFTANLIDIFRLRLHRNVVDCRNHRIAATRMRNKAMLIGHAEEQTRKYLVLMTNFCESRTRSVGGRLSSGVPNT